MFDRWLVSDQAKQVEMSSQRGRKPALVSRWLDIRLNLCYIFFLRLVGGVVLRQQRNIRLAKYIHDTYTLAHKYTFLQKTSRGVANDEFRVGTSSTGGAPKRGGNRQVGCTFCLFVSFFCFVRVTCRSM